MILTHLRPLEGGHTETTETDAAAALRQPTTTAEAAAAVAALRAALPEVTSDAAMQRACVALVARIMGVMP